MNFAVTATPWTNEGSEIPLFSSSDRNRSFSPGVSTVHVYSDVADWVYLQDKDPVLDGKEVKNGYV
jgi:hypothetical protein